MDVQLDLCMRTAGILEGWSLTDYQSQYKENLRTLSTGLEPRVIYGHQWYKNSQYLFYEDGIVVPEARLDECLQWSHLSSGHTGANRSVDFFRECFYSSRTLTELRSRMQRGGCRPVYHCVPCTMIATVYRLYTLYTL